MMKDINFTADFTLNPMIVWDSIIGFLSDDCDNEIILNDAYVAVFDNDNYGKMIGAFSARPMNSFCCEVHGGVIKEYWGFGQEICATAIDFFFRNTTYLKMVAMIPSFNKLMQRCVISIGFKKEGVITSSFVKWFRMHDLNIYGLSKGELKCLP